MSSVAKMDGQTSKKLQEKLATLRRDLVANVFEGKSGGTDNSAHRGMIRKEIARVLTVLSMRKIRSNDV